MRKLNFKTSILATLVILFSFTSCEKDDDNSNNNNSNPTVQSQITTNVQSGTWRITKFIDSGTDETANFTGYNFTFGTSGDLHAMGSNHYTGAWSISDDNSNDDTQNDLHFNINFSLTNNFQDLNNDWDFVSQSSIKIELIDVSGGGSGTDYLTFEKN